MIGPPLDAKALAEHIRKMTDKEVEATIAEMVKDGILDEDGNVLVSARVPDPPWLTESNGHPAKGETAIRAEPKKKAKKPRKRS